MKAFFDAVVLFALVTAIALSVPAQVLAPTTEKDKPAEDEVRRLNTEEVEAFLHSDPKAMERLWSDDFVVTNPLNKFVNRQQVLGMVQSGFLVITSLDRQIEYVRVYGNTVIVAGSETLLWGGKMPKAGKNQQLRVTGIWMKKRGPRQQMAPPAHH